VSLLDLLSGPHDAAKKVPGVVIGIVAAVDEAAARVKLKFPVLNEEDESDWARIVVLMAGDQAGAYCLPEVGDEALCAFEHGDIRYPYVLGFLWGKDKPPEAKRQKRLIQSRSGHKILLDDTDGAGAITITTSAGMSIKLEDQPGTVTVETAGGIHMQMADKPGSLELATAGGISVELKDQPGSATVATKSGVSVKLSDAPPGVTIDASAAGKVAITCLQADVTAPAGVTFNTPKATFAGMITALMVQTQVLQSQAVISPSYTPGAGNIL
jgi:phage baseplate assembly protein gpV